MKFPERESGGFRRERAQQWPMSDLLVLLEITERLEREKEEGKLCECVEWYFLELQVFGVLCRGCLVPGSVLMGWFLNF